MPRTPVIILISALALLLSAAGCNKEGKKKVDTSNVEETAPALSAVPEAQKREVTDEEAAMLRAEEQRKDLRTELIAMLPEFAFTYNDEQDSFSGSGLPEEGISIPPLVDKLETRVKQLQSNPGKAEYQQLIRVMLTQFKTAGLSPQNQNPDQNGMRTASRESQPGDDGKDNEANPADEFGLRKATKAYGEWRSIREEGENYVIEHNDDYYKQLLVYYNKNAMYSTFARGQQIKHDVFNYSFDKSTAELLLTPEDGRYNMRLYCYVRDSEPGLMYVKQQQSGNVYTVYEKIGRGEEPMTEEELNNFLELQREISGGGSGNAKKDN